MLAEMHKVHEQRKQAYAYGAVKTWRELKAQGIVCGRHRIARLRRQAEIEARRKRRFRITTQSREEWSWREPTQLEFRSRVGESGLGCRYHVHCGGGRMAVYGDDSKIRRPAVLDSGPFSAHILHKPAVLYANAN